MGFLSRWFGKGTPPSECVLVHLDGTSLPDNVYDECDTHTLSEQLEQALSEKQLGEYDGDEHGPTETILFMYGPDAERLFSVSSLCSVRIRFARTRVSSSVAAPRARQSASCGFRDSD